MWSWNVSRVYPSVCVLRVQIFKTPFYPQACRCLPCMPVTPGPLKAGPRGGIISSLFMLSAWRLRVVGREGSIRPFICLHTRALALCGAGATVAFLPFKLYVKDTLKGCVGPTACCCHSLTVVLEQPSKTLPRACFTLNHCPALPRSGWEVCWHQQKYNTLKISYKLMPPTLSWLFLYFSLYLKYPCLFDFRGFFTLCLLKKLNSPLQILKKQLYLYPRHLVIVGVWPKRTWLITFSSVNMTLGLCPPCCRAPTNTELQVHAQTYVFHPCAEGRLSLTDGTWKRKLLLGEWKGGQGEAGCVDGKFTLALHWDKHREDSGRPRSNSKQLDYLPQAERPALRL